MTDDEKHIVEVGRSVFRPDHFIAECSCSWRGDLKPRRLEAEQEGDEHAHPEHYDNEGHHVHD